PAAPPRRADRLLARGAAARPAAGGRARDGPLPPGLAVARARARRAPRRRRVTAPQAGLLQLAARRVHAGGGRAPARAAAPAAHLPGGQRPPLGRERPTPVAGRR